MTWALQQVGSFLRYIGRAANVTARAARFQLAPSRAAGWRSAWWRCRRSLPLHDGVDVPTAGAIMGPVGIPSWSSKFQRRDFFRPGVLPVNGIDQRHDGPDMRLY
jgi:hypothetical protein